MTGESNWLGLWGNTTHNPVNPQKENSADNPQASGEWWQPSNSFLGVLASFTNHIKKHYICRLRALCTPNKRWFWCFGVFQAPLTFVHVFL